MRTLQYGYVIVVLMSSMIVGCLEPDDITSPPMEWFGASVYYQITPSGDGEFFMYLPILLINDSIPSSDLTEGYFSLGNGSINTVETEFGYAYNISSDEEIGFRFDLMKTTPSPGYSLSLGENFNNTQYFHIYNWRSDEITELELKFRWSYQPNEDTPSQKWEFHSNVTEAGWKIFETIEKYNEI